MDVVCKLAADVSGTLAVSAGTLISSAIDRIGSPFNRISQRRRKLIRQYSDLPQYQSSNPAFLIFRSKSDGNVFKDNIAAQTNESSLTLVDYLKEKVSAIPKVLKDGNVQGTKCERLIIADFETQFAEDKNSRRRKEILLDAEIEELMLGEECTVNGTEEKGQPNNFDLGTSKLGTSRKISRVITNNLKCSFKRRHSVITKCLKNSFKRKHKISKTITETEEIGTMNIALQTFKSISQLRLIVFDIETNKVLNRDVFCRFSLSDKKSKTKLTQKIKAVSSRLQFNKSIYFTSKNYDSCVLKMQLCTTTGSRFRHQNKIVGEALLNLEDLDMNLERTASIRLKDHLLINEACPEDISVSSKSHSIQAEIREAISKQDHQYNSKLFRQRPAEFGSRFSRSNHQVRRCTYT